MTVCVPLLVAEPIVTVEASDVAPIAPAVAIVVVTSTAPVAWIV